ncbi:MAG: hypothetical protein ACOY94_05085 [Bacillota bacterium]
MSEVMRLSWAIARMGWRATYNRLFRFSRVKSGLIMLLLQGLLIFLIARRAPAMAASATGDGLSGVMAIIALQMGWFGLMYGFSRGQFQLYQGLLVPLFQLSPARPLAFLIGRVIEAAPQRSWSTLLWAWAYSSMIPGSGRWAAMALLFAVGLATGMIAHLSGLLLLTFWSRYSPKTMRNGLFLFGGLTLAMATWAVIYLSQGNTVTDLALVMRQYRTTVFGLVVLTAGLPGLLLGLASLVRPDWVEDLYRRGLYTVVELGEQDIDRPGRSYWLPIGANGVLRAVLSREWLQLTRSKVARIQLMIWLAGTVGVFFAGQAMAGQPMERLVQYVGSLSLLAWFLSFGHWVVRVFEQERVTIALYRLAAVPTPRLIAAKLTSIAVPSAALVGLSVLAGSLAARLSPLDSLSVLLWSLLALAAGILGGFGVAAATADQEPEEPTGGAAPRSEMAPPTTAQGSAWWSLARTLAVLVSTALPLWAGAGRAGLAATLPPAQAVVLVLLLPTLLLSGGVWWMLRTWRT